MACLAEDVFDQLSDELDVERRDLTKRLEHHHKVRLQSFTVIVVLYCLSLSSVFYNAGARCFVFVSVFSVSFPGVWYFLLARRAIAITRLFSVHS